ncbi:hypothetical protein N2597_23220 (plasmid) [Rhizobium sophoriradicis]|nr:hypothetical protein [Rhizobium sp. Kim5]UWU37538.1 hypothetical protein N2597_23220 [Rhizobium leguminosarum bv. phaseoli]
MTLFAQGSDILGHDRLPHMNSVQALELGRYPGAAASLKMKVSAY